MFISERLVRAESPCFAQKSAPQLAQPPSLTGQNVILLIIAFYVVGLYNVKVLNPYFPWPNAFRVLLK